MKTKFLAIRGVMARICESLGINRAIKISAILVCGAFFSACVDINLKSEMPNLDYYKLDNIATNGELCDSYTMLGLQKLDIPRAMAGKNILYLNGNVIRNVKGISLNENLGDELESMIIKNFANHCIKAITPPFSGIQLEQFLRIKLIDFMAVENYTESYAKELNSEIRAKMGDAKHIAKVSFMFVLHQNGTILQSGIITEYSAISDFSGEQIFSALQNSSKNAIETLTNKIIPK